MPDQVLTPATRTTVEEYKSGVKPDLVSGLR